MVWKPVGVNESGKFPPRIETRLSDRFDQRISTVFQGAPYTAYGHSFGQLQTPPNARVASLYPARIRDLLRIDPSLYSNYTISGASTDVIDTKAKDTWVDGRGGLVSFLGNQNSMGGRQTEANFKAAVRSFITTIYGNTGYPPALLMIKDTTNTPTGYARYANPSTDADAIRYNTYLDDVIAEFGAGWIVVADPIADGWDPFTMTCPDGQHPNDLGCEFITNSCLKALNKINYRQGQNLGVVSAAIAPPLGPTVMTLSGVAGDGQVTIDKLGGTGTGVTYKLYRGTTATGTPIATTFPFTDTGLTNGTSVSYIATAQNSYGTVTTKTVSFTPAVLIANDNFNRADALSLGTLTSGQTWTDSNNAYGIVNNTAYGISGAAVDGKFALINAGRADVDVSLKLATKPSSTTGGGCGPVIRSDATGANAWVLDITVNSVTLYKRVAGTYTSIQNFNTAPVDGDVFRVTAKGSNYSVFRNGVQLGTTYTDSGNFNSTAQYNGIRIAQGTGASAVRFDDFALSGS